MEEVGVILGHEIASAILRLLVVVLPFLPLLMSEEVKGSWSHLI
jgi:hypothetical protein